MKEAKSLFDYSDESEPDGRTIEDIEKEYS